MVKWPFEKRSAGSRVVVKEKRRSVQWWTERTRSSRKALMTMQVQKWLLQRARRWRCGSLGWSWSVREIFWRQC
ncbi:hypothetical protein D3C71_1881020 [compost metagenome]